jgi:hypothetical protein
MKQAAAGEVRHLLEHMESLTAIDPRAYRLKSAHRGQVEGIQ